MSYVHGPHIEQLPSARERIAAIRKQSEEIMERAKRTLKEATKSGSPALVQAAVMNVTGLGERMIILDLADILLDAMRDGPDVGRIRDIPGKSQMQEQSPPGDAPTGLPPERTINVKQVPDTRQGPPEAIRTRCEKCSGMGCLDCELRGWFGYAS
jgi:hypothetical protein